MALADSVPGVSGGTIAFILGFYDNFIGSLHTLFHGNLAEKKTAIMFLENRRRMDRWILMAFAGRFRFTTELRISSLF